MGCDIHHKVFVYSKVEGKMVPLNGVVGDGNLFTDAFVKDRNYRLLGLFGNWARSDYPELKCLHEGIPDFLKDSSVFSAEIGDYDHTIRWAWRSDLIKGLRDYYNCLMVPSKYLAEIDGGDYCADAVMKGHMSIPEYRERHAVIATSILSLLKKMTDMDNDLDYLKERSNGMIDTDLTLYVTWMDD